MRPLDAHSGDALVCHKNAAVGGGVLRETPPESMVTSGWLYTSSRRIYGVCIVPATIINHSTAPSRRPHRVVTAIIALPWRALGALRCLQDVCRVLTQQSQCVVKSHIQMRMTYKPLWWKYSIRSKFAKLIIVYFWLYVKTHLMPIRKGDTK